MSRHLPGLPIGYRRPTRGAVAVTHDHTQDVVVIGGGGSRLAAAT